MFRSWSAKACIAWVNAVVEAEASAGTGALTVAEVLLIPITATDYYGLMAYNKEPEPNDKQLIISLYTHLFTSRLWCIAVSWSLRLYD